MLVGIGCMIPGGLLFRNGILPDPFGYGRVIAVTLMYAGFDIGNSFAVWAVKSLINSASGKPGISFGFTFAVSSLASLLTVPAAILFTGTMNSSSLSDWCTFGLGLFGSSALILAATAITVLAVYAESDRLEKELPDNSRVNTAFLRVEKSRLEFGTPVPQPALAFDENGIKFSLRLPLFSWDLN
jgi:hypothetical protein